jgi:hypothetical protein
LTTLFLINGLNLNDLLKEMGCNMTLDQLRDAVAIAKAI